MIAFEDEDYIIKLLSSTPIFSGLNPTQLKNLLSLANKQQFSRDDLILEEGGVADGLFIIMQGRVEVLKISMKLKDYHQLAVLGMGQSFGEIAIIDQSPRSATIRAIEDTSVLKISIDNFDRFIETDNLMYSRVMKNIAINLSQRLRYANELLALQNQTQSTNP